MADDNSPVRSRLEQIDAQITEVLRGRLDGPARRAEAKAVLNEAFGYIMGNQLDKYERQRIEPVINLRHRATEFKAGLEELGADDNNPEISNQSRHLTSMGRLLQERIVEAIDALAAPAQQRQGGRKTRKGKTRKGKSRKARYSRRR